MKIISLLVLLTFSVNCFSQDLSVRLLKDQSAPFTGVLLPDDMANKMKSDLIEADLNKQIIESYKKSLDLYRSNEVLYENKMNLYTTQNDKLAESLQSERSISNWGRLAWFILGVGATVGAAWGLSRVK